MFEIPEDAQKLVMQAEGDIAIVEHFTIASNDNYIEAAEVLKSVKKRYQEIEAKRKEMTVPLDETKKRIMDFFRQPLERLSNAERAIKGAMVNFTQEQERIRKAEEERIRALAAEEQKRRDDTLEKEISQAQEQGDTAKAETLLASATEAPALIILPHIPKVEGIKTVTRWKYKIVDEALIPREYLIPNEKLLASVAVSSKGTLKIPGVEFYSESTVASGTG